MAKKKVPARGKRKSIVAEYKAKVKGTSTRKPVKLKKKVIKKEERLQVMTVGENTYTVGDVVWFVDERSMLKHPRALQGDMMAVYPTDSIEPAVGVREYISGMHRAIRARLVGWSQNEAKVNFEAFKQAEETK